MPDVTETADIDDLAAGVERLAGARVLVIGDAMLDRFISGTTERISPEAPVPVLRVTEDRAMLGGAGNVLRNITSLGAEGSLLSVVGDDAAGRDVQRLVTDGHGVGSHVLAVPRRTTIVKERYLAAGQQLLRADRETLEPVPDHTNDALLEIARRELPQVGALVLSDYDKGLLQPAFLAALIDAARDVGCPIIVDPKGRDFSIYRCASVITPNLRELEEALGRKLGDDQAVVDACGSLIENCGIESILATRGERGMTLVDRDGGVQHFRAQAREVFDVSGAGDTVVAVLGAAVSAGLSVSESVRLANTAAGIVVGKVGTAEVRPAELRRALHEAAFSAAENKVVSLDSLTEELARWRRTGLRVGFTNGCFDLLHPGHLSLLGQARAACDCLVVGLNSDASVKRLKGETRPLQGEAARAAVLASLAGVDRVVIFPEDTPLNLIEAIRPDVLIKGADYALDEIVGAAIVQSYGGQVVLAEVLEGHSTTDTIQRMRESDASTDGDRDVGASPPAGISE